MASNPESAVVAIISEEQPLALNRAVIALGRQEDEKPKRKQTKTVKEPGGSIIRRSFGPLKKDTRENEESSNSEEQTEGS